MEHINDRQDECYRRGQATRSNSMDYFLTEDQKEIKKLARRIAEEKIVPVRAELDETETFPWDIMQACADTGLFGVSIPEAYGGLGGGSSRTASSWKS